ncbi:MAG: hypothetical protein AAFN12_03750, partial [Cyanobacteria bacterium J06560_2]
SIELSVLSALCGVAECGVAECGVKDGVGANDSWGDSVVDSRVAGAEVIAAGAALWMDDG